VLYPIDRSNYTAIPNKTTEGPPTSFWYERLQSPNLKLWPAVDGGGPYTLNYYVFRQFRDAIPSMGITADLVNRFIEAYVAEVAAHVALKWAPERVPVLAMYATACFRESQLDDVERVSTFMVPDFSGYFSG
jgi:hypothetical protein